MRDQRPRHPRQPCRVSALARESSPTPTHSHPLTLEGREGGGPPLPSPGKGRKGSSWSILLLWKILDPQGLLSCEDLITLLLLVAKGHCTCAAGWGPACAGEGRDGQNFFSFPLCIKTFLLLVLLLCNDQRRLELTMVLIF